MSFIKDWLKTARNCNSGLPNKEGLTFKEWCAAAKVTVPGLRHGQAWEDGEDPTEYPSNRH